MRCSNCRETISNGEDYYKVWDFDVNLCEACKDDIVNYDFCDLCGIEIVCATLDKGDPDRCDY